MEETLLELLPMCCGTLQCNTHKTHDQAHSLVVSVRKLSKSTWSLIGLHGVRIATVRCAIKKHNTPIWMRVEFSNGGVLESVPARFDDGMYRLNFRGYVARSESSVLNFQLAPPHTRVPVFQSGVGFTHACPHVVGTSIARQLKKIHAEVSRGTVRCTIM